MKTPFRAILPLFFFLLLSQAHGSGWKTVAQGYCDSLGFMSARRQCHQQLATVKNQDSDGQLGGPYQRRKE